MAWSARPAAATMPFFDELQAADIPLDCSRLQVGFQTGFGMLLRLFLATEKAAPAAKPARTWGV